MFLFFSPDAGIKPHFKASLQLYDIIKKKFTNNKIYLTNCDANYSWCTVYDAARINNNFLSKKYNCLKCKSNFFINKRDKEYINLKDYNNEKIKKKLLLLNRENFKNFEFENINFSNLAFIDLILKYRIIHFDNLSKKVNEDHFNYTYNSFKNYLILKEIILNKKIKYIFYYGDYSFYLSLQKISKNFNVNVYSLNHVVHSGDVDRSQIIIKEDTYRVSLNKLIRSWQMVKDQSIPSEDIDSIFDASFKSFFEKVTFGYSKKRTGKLGSFIKQHKPKRDSKIVSIFTSSYDEALKDNIIDKFLNINNKKNGPFESQLDWISKLINKMRDIDALFIVKIHPRELYYRGKKVESENYFKLLKVLETAPKNCIILYPDTNISTYDLLEYSNVVLTSWSTVGIEAGRLGIPVLHSDNNVSPVPENEFLYFAKNEYEYYLKLEQLIKNEWQQFERIKKAIRWYNLFSYGYALNLKDKDSKNKILQNMNFDTMNAYFNRIKSNSSEKFEDISINKNLIKFFVKLCSNKNSNFFNKVQPYNEKKRFTDSTATYKIQKEKIILYLKEKKFITEYSPLKQKLLKLIIQSNKIIQ